MSASRQRMQKKLDKLEEKKNEIQEQIDEIKKLFLKSSYYHDCIMDVWMHKNYEYSNVEGVNLDGVDELIFGKGNFEDCFDMSERDSSN